MTAAATDLRVIAVWNLACQVASVAHLLLGQAVVLPLLPARMGKDW
jgi:hypothetical protein